MSKSKEKLEALVMRRQGMSIKDIAKQLQVSKGSVSIWCQAVALTPAQQKHLLDRQITAGHAGRMKGARMNKQKREEAVDMYRHRGAQTIGTLSHRDLCLLGIGLYWGEGVKSRSGGAAVVNSDVAVIKIAKQWFEDCLGVSKKQFRPYLYIAEQHYGRSEEICTYWSKSLAIPKAQFHKPFMVPGKHKKKFENDSNYHGVLSLRVTKSAHLKYEILGLIKACSNQS